MKRNTLIALGMVLGTEVIIIVLCLLTSTPLTNPAISALLGALNTLAVSLGQSLVWGRA
jgi:hypothetical protein